MTENSVDYYYAAIKILVLRLYSNPGEMFDLISPQKAAYESICTTIISMQTRT